MDEEKSKPEKTKPEKTKREFRMLTEANLSEVENAVALLERSKMFFPDNLKRKEILDSFRFVYLQMKVGVHPSFALRSWTDMVYPRESD